MANRKTVYGVIQEAESSETIPFVTVFSNKGELLGIGNLEGYYHLELKMNIDTLIFSCIGFKEKLVDISFLRNSRLDISLEPEITYLSELVIRPEKLSSTQLGFEKLPEEIKSFTFGKWEYSAIAIGYKVKKLPARLTKSRIHVANNFIGNFAIRCRITEADEGGKPGKNLIEKNLIINTPVDDGWVTFNLEDYDIWIDSKRIFVVFEILQDRDITEEFNVITHAIGTPGFSSASRGETTYISTKPGVWRKSNRSIVTQLELEIPPK